MYYLILYAFFVSNTFDNFETLYFLKSCSIFNEISFIVLTKYNDFFEVSQFWAKKLAFSEPPSQKSYNRTDTLVVKEAAIYISYSFKQELSLFSIKGSGRMRTLNRMDSNYDLMYRFYIQNEDKLYEKN